MNDRDLLGGLHTGRLLDVATGDGSFIRYLDTVIASRGSTVGIDTSQEERVLFSGHASEMPDARFELMDATAMTFPPASFDTASMAHSMCEFDDPWSVVRAMTERVVPGGCLVIAEGFRDQPDTMTMTHALFHDWWSDVDVATGGTHHRWSARTELAAALGSVGLEDLRMVDVPADDGPAGPDLVRHLDDLTDRKIARLRELPSGRPDLQAWGEELRARLHDVGFRRATALLAVGRTPA